MIVLKDFLVTNSAFSAFCGIQAHLKSSGTIPGVMPLNTNLLLVETHENVIVKVVDSTFPVFVMVLHSKS